MKRKANLRFALASRWRLIAAAVLAVALIAKSLVFSSNLLFNPRYVSDEIYYISAGKYFMYRLGVLPEFKPPILVNIVTMNDKTIFKCTPLESEAVGITIYAPSYNWANIEHPAFAKLVYGVLICILGKITLLRLVLLIFSSVMFALFFYTLISRYNMLGAASAAVFLFLDGMVHHFTYLAFLDTLMLSFLMLSVTMLLRGDKRAVIPLALAAASKEVAVILAIPFSLFLLLRKERKWALIYLLAASCACLLFFVLNMAAASLSQIIETIFSMARIYDPHACKNICLLSLREEWGMFTLYPALLWLWFVGAAIKIKERWDMWLLPYLLSITNIIFVISISFLRSVYIFYYTPALALSPVAIADITRAVYVRTTQKTRN